MSDILEKELPEGENDCVTKLEAIVFICEAFHHKLRRSRDAITRHSSTCPQCQAIVEKARANLERDKAKLTSLFAQARAPFGQVDGPPTSAAGDMRVDYLRLLGGATDGPLAADDDKDYAMARLVADDPDKKVAALYVAHMLPMTEGSGLFVDAGSQCYLAYRAISDEAYKRRQTQLHLVTSNKFVLDSWECNIGNARRVFSTIEIAGREVDVAHRAFYGLSENPNFKTFRPWLALIGAAGFEVEAAGRLWLGTHAGDHEIADKRALFTCSAKKRVILLAPGKIGHAGCKPVDLLSINESVGGPIYIVSAAPKKPEDVHNFNKAIEAMNSPEMRAKLHRRRIEIHWITIQGIDYELAGALREDVFPRNSQHSVTLLEPDSCDVSDISAPASSKTR